MRSGKASVMSEIMGLNASVRSTGVLVASGIGVFKGKSKIMVVGS